MGIEKLRNSLLSEASGEADRIVSQAKAQAGTFLEEERKGAEAMKAQAEKEVKGRLEEERNERLAWARLEGKRIVAEAEEDAIKSVSDDIMDALGAMHGSAEYKSFMKRAIESGCSELDGNVVVHVKKGEKALVPKTKGISGIEDDLEGLGGAMIESANGEIRVNCTLEMLLEAKRDDLRKIIHEKLFGERGENESRGKDEPEEQAGAKRKTVSGGR